MFKPCSCHNDLFQLHVLNIEEHYNLVHDIIQHLIVSKKVLSIKYFIINKKNAVLFHCHSQGMQPGQINSTIAMFPSTRCILHTWTMFIIVFTWIARVLEIWKGFGLLNKNAMLYHLCIQQCMISDLFKTCFHVHACNLYWNHDYNYLARDLEIRKESGLLSSRI